MPFTFYDFTFTDFAVLPCESISGNLECELSGDCCPGKFVSDLITNGEVLLRVPSEFLPLISVLDVSSYVSLLFPKNTPLPIFEVLGLWSFVLGSSMEPVSGDRGD